MFIRTFSIHKCFYPSSRSDIKFTRLGPEDQSVMQKDPEERSHSQDLQILVVADGYPVRLCGSPLYLVDLPLSSGVSQNWVLDSPRHLLDVPDQGLVIIASSADMARGMGGPGNAIHTGAVVV